MTPRGHGPACLRRVVWQVGVGSCQVLTFLSPLPVVRVAGSIPDVLLHILGLFCLCSWGSQYFLQGM